MTEGKFSRGIEKVIALAALDGEFRAKLLCDREAAMESCETELTENEQAVLLSIPEYRLRAAVDGVHVPDEARRQFLAGSVKTAVAVIIGAAALGLIAYTAVPMLLESRSSRLESHAISILRQISVAQEKYANRHNRYAATFGELVDANLLIGEVRGGKLEGYTLKLESSENQSWKVIATPEDERMRWFRVRQDGVIYTGSGEEEWYTGTMGSRP